MPPRPAYPSDRSDDEWAFAAPCLALVREDAPQRRYDLREMFNAVRWIARAGAPWRLLPNDLPPWHAAYEQAQRWIQAGVFEQMAHDLRAILRVLAERKPEPTAAILDRRTVQSTPTSGGRAGYDGAKRKNGSKVHAAVDTLGYLLTLVATPANEQDRAQVGRLAEAIQRVTGESVELAWVDQGYTGTDARGAASEHGIELEVVTRPGGTRGFVLLPRRWVVERSFGWAARFRRLARDYERLPETLAGLHYAVFACLMLQRAAPLLAAGP